MRLKVTSCLVLLVVLGTICSNATAAIITYSFSGTITPNTGDPWGLGGPKTYSLSVDVDEFATDVFPATTNGLFQATGARVTIDGQAYTATGVTTVLFVESNTPDAILFSLINVRSPLNVFANFGAAATIGESAFNQPLIAKPPVFGTVLSTQFFATSTPYRSDVAVNTPVVSTITPEPASLAIWGIGALGCAIAGYRRRKLA